MSKEKGKTQNEKRKLTRQANNFYTALARQERLDKEVRAIVKGKGKDPKQKA